MSNKMLKIKQIFKMLGRVKNSTSLVILLIICCIGESAMAQNRDFTKDNFTDKKELKYILDKIAEANAIIKEDKYKTASLTLKALTIYLDIYRLEKQNAVLNYNIAKCYLALSYYNSAKIFFKQALPYTSLLDIGFHYDYGMTLLYLGDFTLAKESFGIYKNALPFGSEDEISRTNHCIGQCDNGLIAKTTSSVENFKMPLRVSLNQKPLIYKEKDKRIIYSKEDISITELKKSTDTVKTVSILSEPINGGILDTLFKVVNRVTVGTNGYNRVFFFKEGEVSFIDIIEGKHIILKKLNLPKLSGEIVSFAINKEETLVFYARRISSEVVNIFYREKGNDDVWQDENSFASANSKFKTEGLFISDKTQRLYFSSNSSKSIGGADIFFLPLASFKHSLPESLAMPFNSAANESFLIETDRTESYIIQSDRDLSSKENKDTYLMYKISKMPYALIYKKQSFLYPEKEEQSVVFF